MKIMEFITGGNKWQFELFRLKLSLCILTWTLHFKAVRKLLPIFQSGGLLCRELFVMDGYLTLNEFLDSADRLSFPGVRWTVGTHRISEASGTKTHTNTHCAETHRTQTHRAQPCMQENMHTHTHIPLPMVTIIIILGVIVLAWVDARLHGELLSWIKQSITQRQWSWRKTWEGQQIGLCALLKTNISLLSWAQRGERDCVLYLWSQKRGPKQLLLLPGRAQKTEEENTETRRRERNIRFH